MGASDDSTDYYEIIKNSIDRSKYTVLKGGIYPYKVVSVLMDKFVISSTRSEYVEIYGFLIKTKGSYYIVPHPIIDPKEGYEVVFERDLWPVIKDNLYKYVKINGRVISRRGKCIHGLIYRGRKAIWAVHIEEAKPPVPKVLSEKDYMDIILDGIELYKAYRGINELYASWFAGAPRLLTLITGGLKVSSIISTGAYGRTPSLNLIIKSIHPNIRRFYELKTISYHEYDVRRYKYKNDVLELDIFARTRDITDLATYSKNIDYYLIFEHIPSKNSIKETLMYKYRYDLVDYVLASRLKTPLFKDDPDLPKSLADLGNEIIKVINDLSLPRFLIGKDRLIDPNYHGQPNSIILVAEALYRIGLVNYREVALNKAKSYIIESIQVLAETIKKGDFYEKLPTDQQYELVRKRIRDIVSTGIECAPIRVIAKELGLDNSIQGMSWLQSIINELLYYGVIAEIKPECYYIVED